MTEPDDPTPGGLLALARERRSRADYRGAHEAASAAVRALDRAPDADVGALADGRWLLGRLAEDLGDPAAAEEAYRAAADAAEGVQGPSGDVLRLRALTRLVAVLRDRGALDEEHEVLAEAITLADGRVEDGVEVADLLAEQARSRLNHGDGPEAERLAARAVAMADAAPAGPARLATQARTRGALGSVLRAAGRYDEAYPVLEQALAAAEAAHGTGSLEAANACNDLGICGKFSGRFAQGVASYERAVAIFEAAVGLDHPDVASLFHNLGGILHASRDFAAAEPWARRAVELRERQLAPEHLAVAADRAAHASILDALGRSDEAEALLRDALTVFERVHGPDHYEIAVTCNNLAAIAQRRGDLEQAGHLYERALAVKEQVLGRDHPEVAITLNNLAVLRRRRGELEEAEELYRRAIAILVGNVEPDHPTLVTCRTNLARLLRDGGRAREADEVATGRSPDGPSG